MSINSNVRFCFNANHKLLRFIATNHGYPTTFDDRLVPEQRLISGQNFVRKIVASRVSNNNVFECKI